MRPMKIFGFDFQETGTKNEWRSGNVILYRDGDVWVAKDLETEIEETSAGAPGAIMNLSAELDMSIERLLMNSQDDTFVPVMD